MGTEDAPVCPRHDGDVAMQLLTLHSDQSAPGQVLGAYECPECGSERRVPIPTGRTGECRASTGMA